MSASMAEVLAEHQGMVRVYGENEWEWCVRCSDCEKALFSSKWTPEVRMLRGVSYEKSALLAHQAEQLAANGYGKLEDAWDEGSRAGWSDRTRSFMEHRTYEEEVAKATPNPYWRPE